jgi:hypothetical protein
MNIDLNPGALRVLDELAQMWGLNRTDTIDEALRRCLASEKPIERSKRQKARSPSKEELEAVGRENDALNALLRREIGKKSES